MRRHPAYRFVICGRPDTPWRDTKAEAQADALDAGLAETDEHNDELVWITVPGEIIRTLYEVEVEGRGPPRKKGPTSNAGLSRIDRIIARREAPNSAAF